MTLILTVPARLALMLYDADTHIVKSFEGHQKAIDPLMQMPAWEVSDGGGNYDTASSQVWNPQETYTATLIVAQYGEGVRDERTFINQYETATRGIMHNTVRYFLARPDLVFSDDRNSGAGRLAALVGVKFSKISRDPCAIYGNDDGSGKFYGAKLTFTIIEELVVKRILN